MDREIRIRGGDHFAALAQAAPALDTAQKKQVTAALEDICSEFGSEEVNYIRAKIKRKISILKGSSTSWVRQMALGFATLYSWFEHELKSEDSINRQTVRYAGATLFYLINPFDLIPDHTVGIGFSDDVLALYLCARQLPPPWTEFRD